MRAKCFGPVRVNKPLQVERSPAGLTVPLYQEMKRKKQKLLEEIAGKEAMKMADAPTNILETEHDPDIMF